ncbi:MAG: hypothetical protein GY864_08365, partial [Desulfobacterales bacterium]|nr:hypothetical protein [Desulfobacterales bacterium]
LELGTVSINLYDVFFLNETIGWIVGDAGTVLRTGDGGKEWILAQMGDLKPLFSVFFKNDKQGWAVGSHGFSQKSNDGGQSWERLDLNTENSLYKVTINKDSGIMVGDLATIFKTDNGGETWVKAPNNLPPPYPWFADAWVLPTAPVKTMVVGKSMILSLEQ